MTLLGTASASATTTTSGSSVTSTAGLTVSQPSQVLLAMRAKVANGRRGGLLRILCVGDSTVAGLGAGRLASWPHVLGERLEAAGIARTAEVSYALTPTWAADTRWASTGTITQGVDHVIKMSAGATRTFTSTRAGTVVRVWYPQTYGYLGGTAGSFTVQVDAGATETVTPTGSTTNPIGMWEKTVASGTHAVKITATQNNAGLYAIGVFSSTTAGTQVINAGLSGTSVSNWVDATHHLSPWGEAQLPNLKPDLVLIALGINDAQQAASTGLTPDGYASSLSTLIERAKALVGGFAPAVGVVVQSPPSQPSTWPSWTEAARSAASSCGVPVVADFTSRYTSFDLANRAGLMNDVTHPSATGCADHAAVIASTLLS